MAQQKLSQKIFERGKVFTISNLLSLLRLVGSFYLYYVIVQKNWQMSILLSAIMIITDYADGYFARKLNQISEMGKILDPLADKVCIGLGLIALYLEYSFPLWIVILVIGRDVLILIGSLILLTRLPYVTPSAMLGKITVTVISLLGVSFLLAPVIRQLELVKFPLEILTLLALVASFIHYAYRFYKKMTEDELMESNQI